MSNTGSWLTLILAGLLEVCWAIGIKYAAGFTRLVPSVVTVVAMGLSVYLLAVACKTLPIGTAYPVWVGVGALGTAIFGMFLFHEPMNAYRILFLVLLLISILGLKLTA
jgi:quaternary ammonium compound-resistance protein SugE